MIRAATPKELRLCTPWPQIGCESTSELTPLTGIIGQDRAVRSLRFGLGIGSHGFNIYLAGQPGTGRTSAATDFLRAAARSEPTPPDWVYVNDFEDPYQPKALRLPPGMGKQFAEDVRKLVERFRLELPKAFEAPAYTDRRGEITNKASVQGRELFAELGREAKSREIAIQATPSGFMLIPTRNDKPLGDEEVADMDEPDRLDLFRRREEVGNYLKQFLGTMRALEKQAAEEIADLDREVADFAIGHMVEETKAKYEEAEGVAEYLKSLKDDVISNQALFKESGPEQSGRSSPLDLRGIAGSEPSLRRYQVNVLVDNGAVEGGPVVTELNPTFANLFGKIEKEAQFGALTTDFTLIRPGALHRANGGYLVLPAQQVLSNLYSYEALKLALRANSIAIEELAERLGVTTTKSLRPEPIPLDVKVVMIGDPYLHFLLRQHDPDFGELFKVGAEFGVTMDRTDENTEKYASFVCTLCHKEKLRHLDAPAVAALIDHSARLAGDQQKLTTEFSKIADIIREADYWARCSGSDLIAGEHIRRAIDEKHYRSNLIEERFRQLVSEGVLLIDVAGDKVGQVNGLSVLSLGEATFGAPSRITASVGLGHGGVVDIEREARLGGPIHTKGVLILIGLLTERYARDIPLALSARLVFEQSYGMVEGDSASLAETCALISSLAGAPIRQSVAVTGSIDQKGNVQPIGGANEKIEGFFDTCRLAVKEGAPKPPGPQGVIIPKSNLRHLMLREDVVKAVEDGEFFVWPVETVDEALQALTGLAAGVPDDDGRYPEGSVNGKAAARLRDLAEKTARFGTPRTSTVVREALPVEAGAPEPPKPPPVKSE